MSALNVGATATPALMQTAGTLPDRGSASLRVTSPTAITVAAAPRPSQVEQSTAPSREVVDQAARRIEDFVKSVGRSLSFSVESGTGHSVLRVVNPNKTDETVAYGTWGRVELTTLTKEFFMPRFLERDETIRRAPRPPYAWDGVGDVRPFGAMEKNIVEGVY